MSKKNQTTFLTKEAASQNKRWYIFDAKGKTLGRFASEVARVLKGKHKPSYTPHVDTGDGVIVINAKDIVVTGNKEAQKMYRTYSGYPGSERSTSFRILKARKPKEIIYRAIKGMMPKTRLGEKQFKKLRVYVNDKIDMQAQNPIVANI